MSVPKKIADAIAAERERKSSPLYSDTYSVLEFQGYVSEVPEYDVDGKELRFYARAAGKPSLRFFAEDPLARNVKDTLRVGQLVRIAATPSIKVETDGYRHWKTVEWKASSIMAMGFKRVRLSSFADKKTLEGLFPLDVPFRSIGCPPKEDELLLENQAISESLGKGGDDDDQDLLGTAVCAVRRGEDR